MTDAIKKLKANIYPLLIRAGVLSAAFSAVLLPGGPVQAGTIADIAFENSPLFAEANFLPGDSVSRWVSVYNKSAGEIYVSARVFNIEDPDYLADRMDLTVKKGAAVIYADTLSAFFSAGTIDLGALAAGEAIRYYDFIVSFDFSSGNEYQADGLEFDISVTASDQAPESAGGYSAANSTLFPTDRFGSGALSAPLTEENTRVLGLSAAPALAVRKECLAEFANPGERGVGYEIIVVNDGEITAYNAAAEDILPDGFSFSNENARVKKFLLGDLAPGEARKLEYAVDIDADIAPGDYENLVIARADNHGEIKAGALLNVRPVGVAGAALIPSGFSLKEFYLLLAVIISAWLAAGWLKRGLGKSGKTVLPNKKYCVNNKGWKYLNQNKGGRL